MTSLGVVLDTHVAAHALISRFPEVRWIREAWQLRRIIPLTSNPTIQELVTLLAYPRLGLSMYEASVLLAEFAPFHRMHQIPDPAPPIPVSPVKGDRPFLELAIATKADALVTSRPELLALANDFPIPIWTPDQLHSQISI